MPAQEGRCIGSYAAHDWATVEEIVDWHTIETLDGEIVTLRSDDLRQRCRYCQLERVVPAPHTIVPGGV